MTEDLKLWEPANIYGKPKIGKGVKIGAYCDIGDAQIGDGVSIGAFGFIPGKVAIREGVWIGPRVTFTHTFPPAAPEDWKETIVERNVKIGASVTILCGVRIGEGAVIGAGSVVTKNIPPGETWAGVPAKPIETKIT